MSQAKRAERSGLLLLLVFRRSPATLQNHSDYCMDFRRGRRPAPADKEMKKKDEKIWLILRFVIYVV
jgi:hypothetical protein